MKILLKLFLFFSLSASSLATELYDLSEYQQNLEADINALRSMLASEECNVLQGNRVKNKIANLHDVVENIHNEISKIYFGGYLDAHGDMIHSLSSDDEDDDERLEHQLLYLKNSIVSLEKMLSDIKIYFLRNSQGACDACERIFLNFAKSVEKLEEALKESVEKNKKMRLTIE